MTTISRRAERIAIMNTVLAHSGINPASFPNHRACDMTSWNCPDYVFESYRQVYHSLTAEEREAARSISWRGNAAQ